MSLAATTAAIKRLRSDDKPATFPPLVAEVISAKVGSPNGLLQDGNIILTRGIVKKFKTCLFRDASSRMFFTFTQQTDDKGIKRKVIDFLDQKKGPGKDIIRVRILNEKNPALLEFFDHVNMDIVFGNNTTKKEFNNLVDFPAKPVTLKPAEWKAVDPALVIAASRMLAACGEGDGELLTKGTSTVAKIAAASKLTVAK